MEEGENNKEKREKKREEEKSKERIKKRSKRSKRKVCLYNKFINVLEGLVIVTPGDKSKA